MENQTTTLAILELAHNLRQERLAIETEMNDYFRLQIKLSENSFDAVRSNWVYEQNRQNLTSLILSKPENRPSLCCQRANLLENIQFVEAHKDQSLKYQQLPHLIGLLQFIHQSPHILATCLAYADDVPVLGTYSGSAKADQMNQISQIISAGLYGNSIHGKDVEMMLKLLEKLLELKVATNEIPRRLLHLGTSSFAKLYHKFHESSLSSKLFLTAALHEPVMAVLIDDNNMLEVDQSADKCEGQPDREATMIALYNLAIKFIKSISSNWIIFPSTVRWLVQTMARFLQEKGCDVKTIHEILTEMVFGHFICPACVSPDLYGITDASVSQNARFNLIQIAQILQSLALSKYQAVDNKFSELYKQFDENIVSNLMEQLLENTYDISEMGLSHQLPTLYNIGRSSILMTHNEINIFLQFLRATIEAEGLNDDEKAKLKSILDNLPTLIDTAAPPDKYHNGNAETSPSKKTTKLRQLSKTRLSKNSSATSLNSDENSAAFICNGISMNNDEQPERVVIIPLSIYENTSKVRPLSEDEVLNMNQVVCNDMTDTTGTLTEKNIGELSRRNDDSDINNRTETKEKPARFSINQDDVSIGNTSVNDEAVSEAPSNHSVASSLDLEENNDNLSDMVSANVSGRGTPNISGRDTPSSQVIDGAEVQQIQTPQMAKILNKARNDIEDKFCKFEIKKLFEGDETISIISDTWSTDVLASDTETIEGSERNFSTPLIPSSIILPDAFQLRTQNFDISETQSESAWSTDVLIASDSEKLNEIDNDDTQSITARSDITDLTPRDQEVPTVNHTPDSPFYMPRVPNINFRPIDPSNLTPRTPESPFSFRSSDDSPRQIDAIRIGDFTRPRPQNRECNGPTAFKIANTQSNSFQSTFSYLATPLVPLHQSRPLRQHSNESQSSNQSANFEQEMRHNRAENMRERKPVKEFIDHQQPLSVFRVSDSNLEKFSSESEIGNRVIKTSINLINPFASGLSGRQIQDDDSAEQVEHRRLSDEQRSVNYDARRNGMIDLLSSPVIRTAPENPFDIVQQTDHDKNLQPLVAVTKANSIDAERDLCGKLDNLKLCEAGPSSSSTGAIAKLSNGSVKPTGAIPKSISFDSTADKVERNQSRRSEIIKNQQHQSTGIFSKIRQGFKNRRGKGRHSVDESIGSNDLMMIHGSPHRSFILGGGFIENSQSIETSDDILAKYRRKPSSSSDAATSDSTGSNNSSSLKSKSSDTENRLSHTLHNPETDYFVNAKRKLRLVLSTSDCHACDVRNNSASTISPLLSYLQIQLAQALNQQNLQQVSYVSELLRCLNSLDTSSHSKLVEELQKDLLQRQSYLQYLVRLRQDLLSTIATIDNFQKRLQNDRDMCNRHLVMVCVRIFLEKRESMLIAFQEEFNSKPAADEKLEFIRELMDQLIEELKKDSVMQGMADWQLEEARNCIERILLQRLYNQVMFPNDDVDISNDRLLHNCIKKLSRVITPSHSALRIPHRYLNEAPWPFAQQQISYISAYKTPQEKVQCVIRCIQSIMYLLKMASNQQPAADDLVPVLIYVIIKANPPYLQSTINYVETFMSKKLQGEESYWWTQFSSAIQFIKTMIERTEKTGHDNKSC